MTSPISSVVGTIDPSSAAAAQAASSGGASSTSNSILDPQAFLQLLVAQLQYQDPTNPVDTSSFMNQTAMLSQVQTMNSMSSTLATLSSAAEGQQATSMIGKQVTYTGSDGTTGTGVVSSVQLLASGPVLQVGTTPVALGNITQVSEPAAS
jgi:flagellar basal-body rod modification protein FlgD